MLGIRRREFITLLGGAASWPLAARAQPGTQVRRVGVLISAGLEQGVQVFQTTLRSLGWIEERNLELHKRIIGPLGGEATEYAKELMNPTPDVLLAGPTNAVLALKQQTRTVPIVFINVADAVEQGIVPSLSRPGGNLTGFTSPTFQIVGKGLQLFHEIAPAVTRLDALFSATSPVGRRYFQAAEIAARSLAIKITAAPVQNRAEIEHSVFVFAREPNGGLYLPPDVFTTSNRDLIIDLAARYNLPSVSGRRSRVDAGGLMSYEPANPSEEYRGAASYVDRILRGEKAGDLPVQQPTRFEFLINLKTAKTLGLTVPPGVLAIADEVLE